MGAPKRVLLIEINEDGTVGGSHQCLLDLVERVDRHRFEPHVLFYQDSRFVRAVASRGLDVHVWDEVRAGERTRTFESGVMRRIESSIRLLFGIVRRYRFLKRQRIDLVHLNNNPCIGFDDWLPASRLARIPIVAHARGPWFDPGSGWARWATRKFDRVVAISDFVAATLERAGIPRRSIRRVYDGIDLARWKPLSPPGTSGGKAGERVEAVMVGHLRSWKGQDVVLAALAMMSPEARASLMVRFVGEAPASDRDYATSLESFVREHRLADCVEFTGYVPDPRPLLERAQIVLHASTLPEPFGLVVVEGMALGKAVVASNHGGPAEIIREGEGLLFDPKNPQELAGHLTLLADSPALRSELGRGAIKRASEFGADRTASEVAEVWQAALD